MNDPGGRYSFASLSTNWRISAHCPPASAERIKAESAPGSSGISKAASTNPLRVSGRGEQIARVAVRRDQTDHHRRAGHRNIGSGLEHLQPHRGARTFLKRLLVDQFQPNSLESYVLAQEIQNNVVEAAVGDDVVSERLRPFFVVLPVVDFPHHPLVLVFHQAQDLVLLQLAVRGKLLVGILPGGDDLAAAVDQALHDRVLQTLVLGLDMEDPTSVVHVGVESGDHPEA